MSSRGIGLLDPCSHPLSSSPEPEEQPRSNCIFPNGRAARPTRMIFAGGVSINLTGGLRKIWWALQGSNLRHSACKADALPTELSARIFSSYHSTSRERRMSFVVLMLAGSHQAPVRRLLRPFASLRLVEPPHSACKADALPTELSAPKGKGNVATISQKVKSEHNTQSLVFLRS